MLSWIWGRSDTKTVTDARGVTRTIPNPVETTTWDARGKARVIAQDPAPRPVTTTAWDARGVGRTYVNHDGLESRVDSEIEAITTYVAISSLVDVAMGE